MGVKWRVLMCLRTLLDLVEKPERSGYASRIGSKRRSDGLRGLQESIDSGRVLLYVPPAMISQVHFAISAKYGIEEASTRIQRLLELAVCTLDIDYDSILRKANACIHELGKTDLCDIINLACAEVLNADAFITESVSDYRRIIDANYREFPDFTVHLMDRYEFIQTRNHAEIQYADDKNAIYAFTPQLDRIKLPRDATPIDFAYKIHTKLGDRCVRALIKGADVPLNTPLQNGDVVEIIKGQEDNLKQSWLEFVVTTEAKRGIQRGLKRLTTAHGWDIIKQALADDVRTYRKSLEAFSVTLGCSVDELAFQVGSEEMSVEKIKEFIRYSSSQLLPKEIDKSLSRIGERSWRLASCCNPLPGDAVVEVTGAANRPRRIHLSSCSTLQKISPEQKSLVSWNANTYTIHLQITVRNTPDVLRIMLNRLADNSITPDIKSLNTTVNEAAKVAVAVNNISREQLDEMLKSMRNVTGVVDVNLTKVLVS